MDFNGNTATVVFDGDTIVRMNSNGDVITVSCESLINRVINDFVNEMVKGFYIRAAHIHAGSAADGFKTFEDLDITCIVMFWFIVQVSAPKFMPDQSLTSEFL